MLSSTGVANITDCYHLDVHAVTTTCLELLGGTIRLQEDIHEASVILALGFEIVRVFRVDACFYLNKSFKYTKEPVASHVGNFKWF